MIARDGSWEKVDFADGCLQTPLLPAQPKVFRVTPVIEPRAFEKELRSK